MLKDRGNGNNELLQMFREQMLANGSNNSSVNQYICKAGQLATALNKNLLDITGQEYKNWLNNGNMDKQHHVNSVLRFLLKSDINSFQSTVDKNLLLHLAIN